jgi:uncharacterized RDD family membrane protein YckC
VAQVYGPPTRSGVTYGGFWIRFVAAVIDGVIVSIPVFIVGIAIGVMMAAGGTSTSTDTSTAAASASASPWNLAGGVIGFLYYTYFWSSGSTPGMRIFHLRVADANTLGTIGFGQAALRFLGYIVSTFCCYIGLIWAAFDPRKQGWHDKLAGTVVVYR